MIQHPDSRYIDPVKVKIRDQPAHCAFVEAETDGKPWYVDIKMFLEKGEYPEGITINQKKTIRKLANSFFLNKNVLYKRTLNLGLLRCVDSIETTGLIEEVHAGTDGPHMNGFMLVKKNVKNKLLLETIENDYSKFRPEIPQVSNSWRLDKGSSDIIECYDVALAICCLGHGCHRIVGPTASNKHLFILVAIDYFTKSVEAVSYASVTKKVVAHFVRNIICQFDMLESIIIDNGANLNSHLMKEMCAQFRITHQNSTAYRPQMNGVMEAANKNNKKILRKMIDNYKDWYKQLPHALLGYRTTASTSTGSTPYLLVYGTEAVIPAKVEIPSLRIVHETELDGAEWIRKTYE
ncbi:uncharacterized protein LOC132041455 [Lycium ferocissimum]|uniref:uncharacterized protein LOC132041455 n=1 Tax=Lycium ferocissimum TaxID=112874 RepID=UPI0028154435|nr:uncharacterized protein LOC132041455 [Lycium ferocissimum]